MRAEGRPRIQPLLVLMALTCSPVNVSPLHHHSLLHDTAHYFPPEFALVTGGVALSLLSAPCRPRQILAFIKLLDGLVGQVCPAQRGRLCLCKRLPDAGRPQPRRKGVLTHLVCWFGRGAGESAVEATPIQTTLGSNCPCSARHRLRPVPPLFNQASCLWWLHSQLVPSLHMQTTLHTIAPSTAQVRAGLAKGVQAACDGHIDTVCTG